MLVNCVAYQGGKKLAEIQQREIKSYLSRPDCFVWVALRDADAAELAVMQDEFDLHELAVEDARHGHQRPKIEEYGDSLFVVMHTVEVVGEDLKVGEVDIFAETEPNQKERILTALRKAGNVVGYLGDGINAGFGFSK